MPVRRSPRRAAAASRAAALPVHAPAGAGDPGRPRLSLPPPSLVPRPHGHGVGPGTAVLLTSSSRFPHRRSGLGARPSPRQDCRLALSGGHPWEGGSGWGAVLRACCGLA